MNSHSATHLCRFDDHDRNKDDRPHAALSPLPQLLPSLPSFAAAAAPSVIDVAFLIAASLRLCPPLATAATRP